MLDLIFHALLFERGCGGFFGDPPSFFGTALFFAAALIFGAHEIVEPLPELRDLGIEQRRDQAIGASLERALSVEQRPIVLVASRLEPRRDIARLLAEIAHAAGDLLGRRLSHLLILDLRRARGAGQQLVDPAAMLFWPSSPGRWRSSMKSMTIRSSSGGLLSKRASRSPAATGPGSLEIGPVSNGPRRRLLIVHASLHQKGGGARPRSIGLRAS
jgi:hypothetical protein